MNASELKSQWQQLTGNVKRHWGKLTDEDLITLEGDRDKLIGKIQERYALSKDEAEQQVDEWIERL